ncbi:MAG: hypothetical protein FWH06_04130 [Oscillospiraceae bacterium]|nr:hypothetical protein [Oscillospiraceae bacterium]
MSDPNALAASVTALAITIADGRSPDEIGLLGAIFTQLGDTLTTISVQKNINVSKSDGSKPDEGA